MLTSFALTRFSELMFFSEHFFKQSIHCASLVHFTRFFKEILFGRVSVV